MVWATGKHWCWHEHWANHGQGWGRRVIWTIGNHWCQSERSETQTRVLPFATGSLSSQQTTGQEAKQSERASKSGVIHQPTHIHNNILIARA